MKNYYVIAFLAINSIVYSQVGINTTTPRATLDIVATANSTTAAGLLPPILKGDDIKGRDGAYDSHLEGAIVYANAPVSTGSTKTSNITKAGYYYFDGNIWKSMTNSFLTGNSKIITTDYTATDDDCVIESHAPQNVDLTIALPAATPLNKGKVYLIYNANADVLAGGYLTIGDQNDTTVKGSRTVTEGKGKMVVSDGSRWIIIGF